MLGLNTRSLFLAIIYLVAAAPWLLATTRRMLVFFHILQIEEYETTRYFGWVIAHPGRLISPLPALLGLGASLCSVAFWAWRSQNWSMVAILFIWLAIGLVTLQQHRRPPARKKIVFTSKLLFLLVLGMWLGLLLDAFAVWIALHTGDTPTNTAPYVALVGFMSAAWVINVASAFVVGLANLALYPLQWAVKELVVALARRRLRHHRSLTIIGIAGSYGKTSTKEILASLLAAQFKVLKTPASFNTPLGIARVILRDLRPEHQIFVVELGEYYIGDIAKLCRIVRPHIGVVTAVNAQHLERLGTLENVARTMYELIEALPAGGTAIFNNDNEWCRDMAQTTEAQADGRHVVRYGLDSPYIGASAHASDMDIWADEIVTDATGVSFALHARTDGQRVRMRVPLLGRHNVQNVLAASAVALACGMTVRDVALAASRVQPIPHRLQLLPTNGGVTVIDDGYNANPDGVAAALEVLRDFAGTRKVLVTPGLVELGTREFEENKLFGRLAARACDLVILVGRNRTVPILEGLQEERFPTAQTIIVKQSSDVPQHLRRLLRPGDVVLITTDLPDTYDEDDVS